MDFSPISILLTIFGGLVLAGLLGWIKKPRIVVFVPRLFLHPKISDKGQIVEISVMNRGFKTEENIELSLSPSLHYELIGSNNPDATLTESKLIVPRIGSADDCSALLLVENGKFTHSEIVNCLSKDTKAIIATKLEDVPVTAQQRVGILMFFGLVALIALVFVTGIDYVVEKVTKAETTSGRNESGKSDIQGWNVGSVYRTESNSLYQSLIKRSLVISTGTPQVRKNQATVRINVENNSPNIITLRAEVVSSLPQDVSTWSKRTLSDAVVFQGDSIERDLQVAIPSEVQRRKVIVEIFVESTDGDAMSARKILNLSEP